MEYKNIFGFSQNWKTFAMLSFLALLPNFLGMLQYTTVFGLRIHFFQYAIFLAALLYGPVGGFVSGAIGSVYVAISLNNPYVIIGNIILGLCFGLFIRYGWHWMAAVLAAYAIQMPWLWITDVYFAKMPVLLVITVVASLLISNIIFVSLAKLTYTRIKDYL